MPTTVASSDSSALRRSGSMDVAVGMHNRSLRTEDSLTLDQRRDSSRRPQLPAVLANHEAVIIGAGISGLETARRLSASGMRVTVYEGQARVGGRIFTDECNGHRIERGAELINASDLALRALISDLGLNLREIYRTGQKGQRLGIVHSCGLTPIEKLVAELRPVQEKMRADIERLGGVQAAQDHAASISLQAYAASAGLGADSLDLLMLLFESEYGRPVESITAQGLFFESFHLLTPENPTLWGAGYAQYRVEEGSGAITQELAKRVDTIHLEHQLTKIVKDRVDGGYTVTFDHRGTEVVRHVPLLVVAMPYTALRHVDLSESGLSSVRLHCIDQMTYGRTAKTFVESSTPGDARNIDEFVDAQHGFSVWNEHRNSSKPSTVWTVYTDGEATLQEASLIEHLNKTIQTGFERVLSRAMWNDRYSGGSYSIDNNHLPIEGRQPIEAPGELYFAGEHTQRQPSYMDAAVRSAIQVSDSIVEHLLSTDQPRATTSDTITVAK
jgi:monoamine oxidase